MRYIAAVLFGKPVVATAGLILALLCFSATGWPIPGDVRYVDGAFAVVREEPHGASATVAKIAEGQAVLEIQRQGNWLNVGVLGAGITGWIHLSFLKEPEDAQRRSQPLIAAMRRFRPVFDAFNAMKAKDGERPFASASQRENGLLRVSASSTWWSKPLALRKSDLVSLHQMWKVANEQLPVTVIIEDPEGRRVLRYPAGEQ